MATETIPNLWFDIRVEVITPYAVLQAQASRLSELTQGLLRTEIITKTSGKTLYYEFDVIAPVLNNYRHTLLIVEQIYTSTYPVRIQSVADSKRGDKILRHDIQPVQPSRAAVQILKQNNEEHLLIASSSAFVERVGEVLQSPQVQRIITSLVERSNEQRANDPKNWDKKSWSEIFGVEPNPEQ